LPEPETCKCHITPLATGHGVGQNTNRRRQTQGQRNALHGTKHDQFNSSSGKTAPEHEATGEKASYEINGATAHNISDGTSKEET
jgi:hypothetical protein